MHSLCGCMLCVYGLSPPLLLSLSVCVRKIMANVKTIADAAVRSQLAGNMIHFQMFLKMFSLPAALCQFALFATLEKSLACLAKWVILSEGWLFGYTVRWLHDLPLHNRHHHNGANKCVW